MGGWKYCATAEAASASDAAPIFFIVLGAAALREQDFCIFRGSAPRNCETATGERCGVQAAAAEREEEARARESLMMLMIFDTDDELKLKTRFTVFSALAP